jgi:hypothetical protein
MRKLSHWRYGPALPDDDAGREELYLRFKVISLRDYAEERMGREARLYAPWITPEELESAIQETLREPAFMRMMTAEMLGQQLGLTNAERERLNIRTIAPIDRTPGQLEQQRRARDRRRKALARRKAKPEMTRRAIYLSIKNKSALKPWLDEGMSRAKWYRLGRHKAETATPRETSVSAINLKITNQDIPVSHTPATSVKRVCMGVSARQTGIVLDRTERTERLKI